MNRASWSEHHKRSSVRQLVTKLIVFTLQLILLVACALLAGWMIAG